jgi:DNA-binding CsgD family transcriptional regulator
MELTFLDETRKAWNKLQLNGTVANRSLDHDLKKRFLDFFQVGDSYYFIVDIKSAQFTHLSRDVAHVLGYEKDVFTVEFMMSKIHPDDHLAFLNHTNTAVDFFKKLQKEKITKYKFNKDYRILNAQGDYIRLLQQIMILSYDDDKNATEVFGVHTNITHLKADNTSILSFIGLDGEPSFVNIPAKAVYKSPKAFFTRREKEVVRHLLTGKQTAAIAKLMFISNHTVDTHRKNILNKTKTKSTMEMTIKVISERLL